MTSSRSWSIVCLAAGIGLGPLCAHGFAQGEQSGRIGEKQVFAELAEQNRIRSDALIEYAATRVYRVSDPSGKIHAQEEGRMEFHAPDRKTFVVTSEQGPGIVRRLALNPLIAGEINAAAGKDRRDSAISSANYQVEWIGEEDGCPSIRTTAKSCRSIHTLPSNRYLSTRFGNARST